MLTKIDGFSLLCDFNKFLKGIKRMLKLEEQECTKTNENLEICD